MHFVAFQPFGPYPQLRGYGFSNFLTNLLGLKPPGHPFGAIRSGKLVALFITPVSRWSRIGVYNTLFVGEAFGNFGLTGVIIAVFLVPFLHGLYTNYFSIFRKSPIVLATLSYASVLLLLNLIGGFLDFLWNPRLWLIMVLPLANKLLEEVIKSNFRNKKAPQKLTNPSLSSK